MKSSLAVPRRAALWLGVSGLIVGAGAALPVALGAGTPSPCGTKGVFTEGTGGAPSTCTYSSPTNSGFEDTFTVPVGITSIGVVAVGGKGGSAIGGAAGGHGAHVSGALAVTAGTTLYVDVGGNAPDQTGIGAPGSGGFNGGATGLLSYVGGACIYGVDYTHGSAGGGGASDIRTVTRDSTDTLASRLLVAGGGGGGGSSDIHFGRGGDGGAAGAPGASAATGALGGGAATSTAAGTGAPVPSEVPAGQAMWYGLPGENGVLGTGGRGGRVLNNCDGDGGGGGGGYYGGGGGGGGGGYYGGSGGGGGGGSSLVPTGGSATPDSSGAPQIVISINPDGTAPLVTAAFTPGTSGWFTASPATGTVTADDSATGGSDITAIECSGGSVGTVTGLDTPSATAPVSISAEGSTEVTCSATDSAGNTGTGNAVVVQLDSAAPTVGVTSVVAPADGFMPAETFTSGLPATVGAVPVTVAGTASDATSGIASVSVNGNAATGTTTWSGLAGGGTAVTAVATDAAGNHSSATAANVDLDLDDDGIANNIDGNSTVSPPASQVRSSSTRFSDKPLGGATSGAVKSLVAGAAVAISDSSVGGVSVVVSGSGQAKVTLDGKAGTVSIPAGGHAILTDPAGVLQVQMLAGASTIDYLVNGEPVTISVAEGATAVVSETYTNGRMTGINVTAPGSEPGSVTVNGIPVGSSTLSAKLTLSSTRFELAAVLTPAAGADVRLAVDDVAITIGAFHATIPGPALKRNKQGYAFTYPVGGVTLTGLITPETGSTYRVSVKGSGPNRAGTSNPVGVAVSIGDATAYALVTAKLG